MTIEKQMLIQPPVQVKSSDIHRYGVFATHLIKQGEIIEECPILIFDNTNYSSKLDDYAFNWADENHCALALGYGSIYNHAEEPNAKIQLDFKNELVIFTALRPIFKGEEICIYYSEGWFKKRNLPIRQAKKSYKRLRIIRLIIVSLALLAILLFLTYKNH